MRAGALTARLSADMQVLRGKILILETGKVASGVRDAPTGDDWKPRRLGAEPPAGLVSLRAQVEACLSAVFGVSPSLLVGLSDGTAMRESWRRLLHGVVAPLGNLLAAELRLKLGTPDLTIEWRELSAADTAGRGRAFRQLVGNGQSQVSQSLRPRPWSGLTWAATSRPRAFVAGVNNSFGYCRECVDIGAHAGFLCGVGVVLAGAGLSLNRAADWLLWRRHAYAYRARRVVA